MLPIPAKHPLDCALYLVFGLELLILCGGLAVGRLDSAQMGRLPRALRMALSSVLVLASLLWFLASNNTPAWGYAIWILLGMACGSLGDWIMAELIPVANRLVGGMGAFGLGHLFYVAAILLLGRELRVGSAIHMATLLAVMWSFSVWAWWTFVRKPGGSRVINGGSLVYGCVIGTMVASAIALALADARFITLAAGTLLFLTSDLVLGNWVIRGHSWRSVNDVVWTTYVAGQLLIVYSVSAALSVLQ